MNFSNINKAFKEQWNFIPVPDDSDKGQLSELLNKSIQELKAKDTTDFNIYFTAFIEDIESVFPDAPWYNSVGLDIRNDLFNTQNPQITAEHILDSIIDANAYRNSDLREAVNPENAAINKVIYEVATGKSRAIKKLEKMGYEVTIDDDARKDFGRRYFGDTITIRNPKTGNAIIGNTGTKNFDIVSGAFLKASPKYGKQRFIYNDKHRELVKADPNAFDYKNFLDKGKEAPDDNETELSKFKKDKALLDRENAMYQRLKDADDRVSSIRDRIAKNKAKMSESWGDKYAGTTAVFKVKPGFDTAENWGVSEVEMNEIFSHNNDTVTIQSLCVEGIPTNFKNSFWNIRFDDGLVLDGVSGYNLYQ
jgi:hypothetical protein